MGMAPPYRFPTILSLIISFLLFQHTHLVFSLASPLADQFLSLKLRSGSRFLAENLKKGKKCDPVSNNICPGISLDGGPVLLKCCKKHCRDVLTDRNNCGDCNKKCGFGRLCCNGVCTDIAYNVNNCGKCGKKCNPGVKCEYGSCGYA